MKGDEFSMTGYLRIYQDVPLPGFDGIKKFMVDESSRIDEVKSMIKIKKKPEKKKV